MDNHDGLAKDLIEAPRLVDGERYIVGYVTIGALAAARAIGWYTQCEHIDMHSGPEQRVVEDIGACVQILLVARIVGCLALAAHGPLHLGLTLEGNVDSCKERN